MKPICFFISIFGSIVLLVIACAKNTNHIRLAPYFLEDPLVVTGKVNGRRRASKHFSAECQGFTSKKVQAHLEISEDLEFLRLYVKSDVATTLIIENRSTEEIFCNDSNDINPEIRFTNLAAGKYSVYVGRRKKKFPADFELFITEFQSDVSEFLVKAEDKKLVSISPDFRPDPYILPFEAGGESLASNFGASCRGYIANTPDHIFKLTALFEYLKIYVRSKVDTTLIMVSRRTGISYCNDDALDFNPAISHKHLPAGFYDVYVGMHDPEKRALYTLYITEKP